MNANDGKNALSIQEMIDYYSGEEMKAEYLDRELDMGDAEMIFEFICDNEGYDFDSGSDWDNAQCALIDERAKIAAEAIKAIWLA